MQSISESERKFVAEGARQDVRADGRKRLDYRYVGIECGLLPQANGSARVSIGGGSTQVLAAVKAELAPPSSSTSSSSDCGSIECAVECWAPLVQGRGPERGLAADANAELSAAVSSHIASPGAVDLKRLCVLKGKHVWNIFVDITVLAAAGGALVDACSLAAVAALHDTRLPKLRLVRGEAEGDFDIELDEEDAAEGGEGGGGGGGAGVPFPTEGLPVGVTFSQIAGMAVVDTDPTEEACASARAVVAVNRDGCVCSVTADGEAGISPATLHAAVEATVAMAPGLFERIDTAIAQARGGSSGGLLETAGRRGASAAASSSSSSSAAAARGGFGGFLAASRAAGATLIGESNVVKVSRERGGAGMAVAGE